LSGKDGKSGEIQRDIMKLGRGVPGGKKAELIEWEGGNYKIKCKLLFQPIVVVKKKNMVHAD